MANRTGAVLKRIAASGLVLAVLLSGGCAPPQETEIPSTRPQETEPYEFMPVDPALLAYTEDYTPVDRTLQISADWTEDGAVTELCLENDNIQIRLDLSQGIILTAITDKRLGHSYLTEPTDLFSYRVRTNLEVGGFEASAWFGSSESILVTAVHRSPDGTTVALEARSRSLPMEFTLVLTLRESAVDLQIQYKTAFGGDTLVNIKCPDISEVGLPCEPENARACIPQEIGWTGKYDDKSTYGAADVATSGLLEVPTALNGMDLAVIYADDNTGGIYFADLEGEISQRVPRVQMSIVNKRITGDWVYTASAGETVVMPKVQIGTFVDGDWHKAVDAVLEASPDRVELADDIPAWIRECGGVYATRGIGSGACYMVTDFADSSQRYLTDYRQMPKLLERAREFGTDVIMLCDYQMAAKATPEWSEITQGVDLSAYSSSRYLVNQENKGDYPYIREDWGGNEAFKEGIAAVHEQGGKVIVYMESFIVYQLSMLSQKVKQIAAILPDGKLDATYDDFYSMVASNETWQDKGIEVTRTTDPLTKAPYTGDWTELDYLRNGTEIMTKTAARTQLMVLDDGTLLLIYHDTTNSSRRNLTAAISTDGGYTWTDKLLLDERAVSYPDLSVAPDGSIYIQYDFDRYGLQMMYLSHITVEDIKAGELVSEGSFLNRVINDNDYNKPAPYQKSSIAIEDTTGNWFGANSTSEGYKKNGTEAASGFTSYADSTFTVVSDGTDSPTGLAYLTTGENYIDSGMTVANGAVVFDLYVSDYSSFVTKWGIVSIGDNNSWVGGGMGNTLTWNMRNVVYQSGWNKVWLNLKDAVSSDTAIDLSHIGCFWLYSNQVPADVEIRVRNVRFVEGSDEKPTRPESDERYVALTPANVYLRSTTDGAEKITQGVDKSGRGYLSRGREFLGTSNVEAIGTGDNTVLWLSTMSGGTDESRYNYAIYFASFDNGQTWQEQVVVEHSDPNVQIVDPRLWIGEDGCLYLGWQQNFTKAESMYDPNRLIGTDGLQGSWAVRIENPTDAAQMSAGTPVRISDGSGINPPATVTLDGEKTLLFANALSPDTELAGETEYAQYKGIGLYYYDKAENTYKLLCEVAPGSSDTVDFYEAKALQTGDGYLYVYYRTLSGLQYIKSTQPVTSAAQSVSWSEPAYVPGADGTGQLTTVNSRSNATIVTGADGQEYILLLYHNNTANNARNHLTASLSSDGGATWSYSLELDPKYAVSYPGLKVMDDGRIFISYDYRRYDAQALFLSCITVEDIIAGALVTEGSYLNKTVIHNDHTLAEDQYQDVYQLTTNVGWVSENGQTKHWVINLPNDSGAYGYRKYDTGAEGTYGVGKNVSFSKTENAVVLKGNGSTASVGALLFERSADTYYDLSGVTLENGALKIDIYVDDLNNVVTSGWGVIALSNGTWTGTGDATISWRPQDYLYTDGWNTLWLPFDKATVGASFDLSAVRTFWFAINGAAETDFIKLANISIVNTNVCTHEKCPTCGGCLAENCDHTTGCCTPCTCPVYTYETTYTFPIPASNSTSWVTGGRWCAATNGSTTWKSANQVMTEDGTVLTNAADGTMTITAGQSNGGGSSKTTGLLFLISSDTGIQTGVTLDGGRLALDVYIYDPDAFKANGGTIEIADTNYKNSRWINDGNRLTWDMSGMELTKGWNTLYLDLTAASFTQTASETASTTFDLGSLMYLWIYTSNMPDGEQLAVRNVSFQEKTLAE